MVRKILVVCTGNICRSPMAAGLLRESLPLDADYEIGSAGLRGLDGQPAHRLAVEVMRQHKIDLGPHRARTVSPDLLWEADLILTMEHSQKAWIESKMPAVADRVRMFDRRSGRDIPDPIGGGYDEFETTFDAIDECVGEWLAIL